MVRFVTVLAYIRVPEFLVSRSFLICPLLNLTELIHLLSAAVSHLPKCREKLGLNFPPLDLGTTTSFLNISISDINRDCWNGSEIGSYIIDKTGSATSTAVSK